MAEKRMFSKAITESDAFLDLPLSTQALYFHLCMYADDDGFLSGYRKIMRMVGAAQNEYDLLLAKKFILQFDDGIVVIKHWLMHNYIRKDRYKPTAYLTERSMLYLKENKSYTFDATKGLPLGIPMVDVDKISLVKSSLDKTKEEDSENEDKEEERQRVSEVINYYKENCKSLPQAKKMTDGRKKSINARVNDYGYEKVIETLDKAEASEFLIKSKSWLDYDWIFNPNNFVKISEDKYNNENSRRKVADF